MVDPDRSEVTFEVRHLGLTHVRGRFTRFRGTVRVGDGRLSGRGTVEVASVVTGDERRDHYLRSAAEFFDPEGHPKMRFTSGPGAPGAGEGRVRLEGELEIRGERRPLSLAVDVKRPRAGEGDAERELLLHARGELRRGDYGLRFPTAGGYGDSIVGDTVKLELRLTAVRRRDD